jgi:hypothetical protein
MTEKEAIIFTNTDTLHRKSDKIELLKLIDEKKG